MRMRRGMTTGRGTTVARVFSAASGAVLVAVLAGCSLGDTSGSDPAGSPASATAEGRQPTDPALGPDHNDPPAFHFKSGDLILGDFTYEEVAGNIFNPCEEISAEEFAAIGFEVDEEVRPSRQYGLQGCALEPLGTRFNSTLIVGGLADRSTVEQQKKIISSDASAVVPGLYTFADEKIPGDFCGAAVDTQRGQFGSMVGSASSGDSLDELCRQAIKIMESLYLHQS